MVSKTSSEIRSGKRIAKNESESLGCEQISLDIILIDHDIFWVHFNNNFTRLL